MTQAASVDVVVIDVMGCCADLLCCDFCWCSNADVPLGSALREMYRLLNGCLICDTCLETLDLWE